MGKNVLNAWFYVPISLSKIPVFSSVRCSGTHITSLFTGEGQARMLAGSLSNTHTNTHTVIEKQTDTSVSPMEVRLYSLCPQHTQIPV